MREREGGRKREKVRDRKKRKEEIERDRNIEIKSNEFFISKVFPNWFSKIFDKLQIV